jgi:20S proteasome alpha/beta subunit
MDLGPCTPGDPPGKEGAPHTGTTIVAVSFDGGVVLGADGRVSTGTYISNRASNKIQQLTDSVYLLRSGSAADTQAIGDYGARARRFRARARARDGGRVRARMRAHMRACEHAMRRAPETRGRGR